MFCRKCGREISDGAGFCPWCGQSTAKPTAAPEAGPAAAPEAGPAEVPAAGPAAAPEAGPAEVPAAKPAAAPAAKPAAAPAAKPAAAPAVKPAAAPAVKPAAAPAAGGPVSVGNWFLTMLLAVIPIAYVIMIFVWAFGNSNPSKKNWARASLIWVLIGALAVGLLVFAVTAGGLALQRPGHEPSEPDSVISSSRPDDDENDGDDDDDEAGSAAPSSSPAPANTSQPADSTAAPADVTPAEPPEGFIFPDSDKELLSQQEIARLSDSDLRYAINEIYARHGYIFRTKDLLEYYEQFDWYTPEVPADSFSSVNSFNQIEKQNWTMLVNERNTRPAINAPESEDWVYAALASSGDKSVEALVLRELAEDGKWSKYFDGKASDVWLKEYPTKSSRVRQQATIKTGREFELFITNNANAYRSRMGTVDESMTAYDMAVEEYYLSKFDKMHSELDWLGANPVLDSYVELINGNSWNVYSGYNSGKGTQDCIWFFFFMDETQEIMAEVSFEYVLYSGASSADEDLFNEWYLNLSESLLIR